MSRRLGDISLAPFALCALLTGACGSEAIPTGVDADAGTASQKPVPSVWGLGHQIDIGLTLKPGQETTRCLWVRLPTTEESDVVAIESTLAAGSHHLIVYKDLNHTTEQPNAQPCYPFAGLLDGTAPLYIAQTAENILRMPAGVAYHLPAGQMIRIEAHYLNATARPIEGHGKVIIHEAVKGATLQAADMMFYGTVYPLAQQWPGQKQRGIPPRQKATLRPGFKEVPEGAHVYAFTSHTHQFGTGFTIEKATDFEGPGTMLYENDDWEHPPLKVYPDDQVLTFKPGEGLRWQCSYNNTTDLFLSFGESAEDNEMCFLWAYYYPSQGFKILFQ